MLTQEKRERLLCILRARTNDNALKRVAYEHIEQSGAFTYTLHVLEDRLSKVLMDLDALGGHERLRGLMLKLDAQMRSETSDTARKSTEEEVINHPS